MGREALKKAFEESWEGGSEACKKSLIEGFEKLEELLPGKTYKTSEIIEMIKLALKK